MSLRKWKVIAPLAVTAAGAIAAGVATLMKKNETAPASQATAPAAVKTPVGALTRGVYSFVSGYREAATVEVTLLFDPESTSFDVVSEEYFSYSSASHAALIRASDFDAQIEYAPYYTGEDYEIFKKNLEQKFKGFGAVRYASLEGVRYRDGDSIVLCFPIPGDQHSYVQVMLFKHKDNDDPIDTLPESTYVHALLDTMKIEVRD